MVKIGLPLLLLVRIIPVPHHTSILFYQAFNLNKLASGNNVVDMMPDVAKLNINNPLPSSSTTANTTTTTPTTGDDEDEDEGTGEIPDMDSFVDDNLVDDDKV